MTKKQKQRIIKIIQKDASTVGFYYVPETGDACVIGGLALASRYNKKALARLTSMPIWSDAKLLNHLARHFGIDKGQAIGLQQINDRIDNTGDRRDELIRFVKKNFRTHG